MQAFTEAIAANPLLAFIVVALVYAIGDTIGVLSKAWIPSTFVIACMFIAGYWTFFPKEIISIAGFSAPFTSTFCIYLLVTHMGTTINLKELARQWKVIVSCLCGLVGMIIAGYFIAGMFIDKSYIVAGLPPLTGGIVAANIMSEAAAAKGLTVASVLALAMYSVQGFAGYPLTAIVLKKEGKRLLAGYKAGKVIKIDTSAAEEEHKKKLIPAMPTKFLSTAVCLVKLALVSYLATWVGKWTAGWGYAKIHPLVAALVLGVVFTELGFLEKDALKKCSCFNLIAFGVMLFIFDALKNATPEILGAAIVPMMILIVIGVAGMCIVAYISGKVLKMSPLMAIAVNLTALYGFPPNYVLTDEATTALASNPEEKQYLMDNMLPQMIVGGFVTVTITSVIIAGIFTSLL